MGQQQSAPELSHDISGGAWWVQLLGANTVIVTAQEPTSGWDGEVVELADDPICAGIASMIRSRLLHSVKLMRLMCAVPEWTEELREIEETLAQAAPNLPQLRCRVWAVAAAGIMRRASATGGVYTAPSQSYAAQAHAMLVKSDQSLKHGVISPVGQESDPVDGAVAPDVLLP